MITAKQAPLVIKLGGNALSCQATLKQFFLAIGQYQQLSKRSLAIVHGGGYLLDEQLEALGYKSEKKNGVRVTPYEQMPVIAGVLAGTANKLLQGVAIGAGLRAVGLSLADGALCKIEELDPAYGAVAKVSAGCPQLVRQLFELGFLPLISSIGITEQGQLMNANADHAAVAVANCLQADLLVLSDVAGVLNAKGEVIKNLSKQKAQELIKEGVISHGMEVKVKAMLEAANLLERAVDVTSWRSLDKLVALLAGENVGTRFLPDENLMSIKEQGYDAVQPNRQ